MTGSGVFACFGEHLEAGEKGTGHGLSSSLLSSILPPPRHDPPVKKKANLYICSLLSSEK